MDHNFTSNCAKTMTRRSCFNLQLSNAEGGILKRSRGSNLVPFFAFFFPLPLLCCLSPCQAKRSGHNHRPQHQSGTWTKQLMSRRKMSARYRVLIIHEDVAGSSLNEISAAPSSPSAPLPQGHTLTHANKTNTHKKKARRG